MFGLQNPDYVSELKLADFQNLGSDENFNVTQFFLTYFNNYLF